jgi:hypothetical protein
MDCTICCETTPKFVQCIFCEFSACTSCTRRYLTDTESDPHCMNCKKQWSRDIIDSSFPKSFVNNELKKHRENVLLDREKSLLPSTQPEVERELHKRKYHTIIENLYECRRKLTNELAMITDQIRDAHHQLYFFGQDERSGDKSHFIRKCPSEGCMGYLSTQWKCGICNLWTCPECHEIKGDQKNSEHTCIESNVETAKLINKETRPCPNCATHIYKIDGCDQMFCTNCQTPFSWRTGQKVISGIIHNPHYYQWIRENNNGQVPRQFGDVQCGGLPSIYKLNDLIRRFTNLNRNHNIMEQFFSIHRTTTHIQHAEIPHYEYNEINNNTNIDLRVKYMLKEIDQNTWKNTLQKREKKNNKNLEISQILQMFLDTSIDIFRIVIDEKEYNNLETHLSTFESLRVYSNSSLDKISKRYSCVVPHIFKEWIVNHIKK